MPNGDWTETIVYALGAIPNGVVQDSNGDLYGTTQSGGSAGYGTVFQLSPPSAPGGNWTETILYNFAGTPAGDGSQPNSVPVLGPGGVLYGTTFDGGTTGHGAIYEVLPPSSPGGNWTEVILYSFSGGADGWAPNGVALGPDGNLYGTTEIGGVSKGGIRNQGTVFQLVLK